MKPLSLAKKTAKQAGQELKRKFLNRKFSIQNKSKHEIVTGADKLAEKFIIKEIKRHFPDHAILAEESGSDHKKNDYLWIIDPLDGTTNFVMHNPLFSVSIALAYKNEIIMGVVYVPMLDEMYYAEKNKPAFVNSKKLQASKVNKIENAFLTFCHGSKISNIKRAVKLYPKLKLKAKDFRQLGSAAIELSYVAAGYSESIIIPGANAWDVAAGAIIIKQAGGEVVDFQGKNWNLKSKDILATNGQLTNSLLKYVK